VAASPVLWVLPLTLYLITFMLCFGSDRAYHRRRFAVLAGVAVPLACIVLALGLHAPLWSHLLAHSAALFVCAVVCHGELARSRPAPERLTSFYLAIAAGGALGGTLVAIVAPMALDDYLEYPMALGVTCVLLVVGLLRQPSNRTWVAAPALAALGAFTSLDAGRPANTIPRFRNFYGVLSVAENRDAAGARRVLTHGRVMHGLQFLDDAGRKRPTAYFGPDSGIGLAMRYYTDRLAPLRIAVIGLGVGTIASYGRTGDVIRFYELNALVQQVAGRYFTFRRDSEATVQDALGDARLRLEEEWAHGADGQFDILVVDAFNSDAIPTHLLTAQSADLYVRRLKPGGLLLLHITNQYVELAPVARGLARHLGWDTIRVNSKPDAERGISESKWVILTANRGFLQNPAIRNAAIPWTSADPAPIVWSDDYIGILRVLKF